MDDPPHSRVFVVCGKAVEVEVLTAAFGNIGSIQNVRLIRDKGVAYIKYEKASAAALAVETLHETVLNEGRGPTLKVMLAEAPNNRRTPSRTNEVHTRTDPDNLPPRSRLFLVVPKTADAEAIQAVMSREPDLQYCKTDLIGAKGIVFCKYARASTALHIMETISEAGMLAGYKVKCMLAEPKSKRHSPEATTWSPEPHLEYGSRTVSSPVGPHGYPIPSPANSAQSLSNISDGHGQSSGLGSSFSSGLGRPIGSSASGRRPLHVPPLAAGYEQTAMGPEAGYSAMSGQPLADYSGVQALNGLTSLQAIAALQGAANLAQARPLHPQLPSPLEILSASKQAGLGGLGSYSQPHTPAAGLGPSLQTPPPPVPPLSLLSQTLKADPESPTPTGSTLSAQALSPAGPTLSARLYVVVSKAVSVEMITTIFASVPGLQFCDLKRDHRTGQSRGFCYVTYATTELAAVALEHFNGMECPVHSGHRLKVMWAEPQPQRSYSGAASARGMPSPSRLLSDSTDSLLQQRQVLDHAAAAAALSSYVDTEEGVSPDALDMQPTAESAGEGGGLAQSLHHCVEMAAVQNSLAHMSMPQFNSEVGVSTPAQLKPPGRRQPPGSPESDADSASASGTIAPTLTPPIGIMDDNIVYTILSRPLPSYALEHVFSQYGAVDWVRLQRDASYGVVRFLTPGSAAAALDALNGTDICGQALTVLKVDPLNTARNKRPRMAE